MEALEQGTRVDIDVRGAASNSMLPWHLHEGTCGSGGAIVGDPAAYSPLAIEQDGTASSEAERPLPASTSGPIAEPPPGTTPMA